MIEDLNKDILQDKKKKIAAVGRGGIDKAQK